MINENMVEAYCPRCNSLEMWDHVIRYLEIIAIRKKFIEKLLLKMLKNRDDIEVNLIILFCEDILRYLEDNIEDEDEYEINQHYIGIKELFRGYIVLD